MWLEWKELRRERKKRNLLVGSIRNAALGSIGIGAGTGGEGRERGQTHSLVGQSIVPEAFKVKTGESILHNTCI